MKSMRCGLLLRDLPWSLCVCLLTAQAQPPRGTRGTRPLQLWRSREPSVFGHLQLLQLADIFLALCEAYSASRDLLVKLLSIDYLLNNKTNKRTCKS